MLRFFYCLLTVICIVPILPALFGMISATFGYVPAIGLHQLSLNGIKMVFAWNGIGQAIGLTLFSALTSTYLACMITFAILQHCWHRRFWRNIEYVLAPLLSMPHVAFAIGFALFFAPTGMGVRAMSHLFGLDPLLASTGDLPFLVNDPYGLGLIMMLAFKEVPFLLLMSIAILQQLKVDSILKVGRSLGYSTAQIWWKCLLPLWLPKLRFPLFAVIAYSLSVVDVALILGPTHPPTLAVLVWQWFCEPDLTYFPRACAGAMLLFLLALALIGTVRFIDYFFTQHWRSWQFSGRRGRSLPGKTCFFIIVAISAGIAPLLGLWSVAFRWAFPAMLPTRYSLQFWQQQLPQAMSVMTTSLLIALISASVALLLAIIAHEYHQKYRFTLPRYVIALPMLFPQLSLLFGLQTTTLYFSGEYYFFWVCWAHVFFAFPFIYLALDGAWLSYDSRLTCMALSLGKSPLQAWLSVKLPLLLSAIIFAWVVGISVSLTQYLPTLILGAGRISTITTEAVALSSGFDRRIIAIYAILQATLPLCFFFMAFSINQLSLRRPRNTNKGTTKHESLYSKPHSTPFTR